MVGGAVVDRAGEAGGEGGEVGGWRRGSIRESAQRALVEAAGEQLAASGEGRDGLVELGDPVAIGGEGRRALVAVHVPGAEAFDEGSGLARSDSDSGELADLGDRAHVLQSP